MEEEIKAREANTPSRRTVTRSPEYYDPEKHVISRDVRGSSYSLFEMNDRLSSSQVVRCDPNAGFRGRKVTKPFASERHKTNKSAELNPSESILKNKTKLQRPFSADYNRNKMRSIQPNGRAKSARPSQDRHVQWLQGQRSRSTDSLVSDTLSDEEKENNRESKQSNHGRYEDAGEPEQRQKSDERVNSSDTDSSLSGSSSGERKNKRRKQKVDLVKGLSRQKKQKLRIFQSDPEKFYVEKLQQKFSELEKLMASPLTCQKSQMLQQHLQQIDQLHNQYKVASHGLLSPGPISLPEDIRHRSHQPTIPAAKNLQRKSSGSNNISCERDHRVTVQSVEPITNTGRLKTDSHIDTPTTTATSEKKKKIVDAKLSNSHNDKSKTNNQQAETFTSYKQLSSTPSKISAVDHHIKFSNNEYLRKWLKHKDKRYRRNLREDRKQEKEEKERLIVEANEKLERKIQSQKVVESWMKEKDKEMTVKYKEFYSKYKELNKNGVFNNGPNLPGISMTVKPVNKKLNDSKLRNSKHPSNQGYDKIPASKVREIDIVQNERKASKSYEFKRPHPPLTKRLYKRPAPGNISFNMQVRGTGLFSTIQDPISMENEWPGNKLTCRSNKSSEGAHMKDIGFHTSSVKRKEVPLSKFEIVSKPLNTPTISDLPVPVRASIPRNAEVMDDAVHKVNDDDDFYKNHHQRLPYELHHTALEGDESAVAHQEDILVDGIPVVERLFEIDIETSEYSGSKEESFMLSEFEDGTKTEVKTELEKQDELPVPESLKGLETTVTTDSSDNAGLPQGNTTDNILEVVNDEKEMLLSKIDNALAIEGLDKPPCEKLDQEYEVLIELPFTEKVEVLDSNYASSDLPETVKLNNIKSDFSFPLSGTEEGVLNEEAGVQNNKSVRGQESNADGQADTASSTGLRWSQQTDIDAILENFSGLPLKWTQAGKRKRNKKRKRNISYWI